MSASQPPSFPPELVQPFWLGEGERGVLLLHGFAGSPPEMRPLGEWLAGHGMTAHAPLLAGHGTSPEEMALTDHRDWIRSASEALDQMLERCRWVGVAGESMGATLALHLAANRPEVGAVVVQSGVLWLRDWRLPALPALSHLVRWHESPGAVDLYRPEAVRDLYNYGRRPTSAILELVRLGKLVRRELPAVVQPLLVLLGGRDGVVDPRNSDQILAEVSSAVRALRRFERSGHGLSVDVDREQVATAGGTWMERYLGDLEDPQGPLPPL